MRIQQPDFARRRRLQQGDEGKKHQNSGHGGRYLSTDPVGDQAGDLAREHEDPEKGKDRSSQQTAVSGIHGELDLMGEYQISPEPPEQRLGEDEQPQAGCLHGLKQGPLLPGAGRLNRSGQTGASGSDPILGPVQEEKPYQRQHQEQ